MSKAVLAPAAEQDLLDIAFHIGVSDQRPLTAHRLLDEFIDKCDFYALNPQIGTSAESLFAGCRIGKHKRWLIFYHALKEDIEVVRVLDGSRDYARLFED